MFWFDGFEVYGASAQLAAEYSTVTSGIQFSASGRNGGRCIEILCFGETAYVVKTLPSALSEVWFQGAVTCNQGDAAQPVCFFQLQNASGSPILSVERNAAGLVVVRRGAAFSGTQIGISTSTVGTAFRLIECRVLIHDTTGEVDIKIDGVPEITLAGVDTNGTTGNCLKVRFGGAAGFTTTYMRMDDVAIHDLGGFIGDGQGVAIGPDGTAANTFGTLVGAATAHEALDEAQPDGDTSYIESASPGEKCRLTLAPHGLAGVGLLAFAVRGAVRQPVAGASQCKVGIQHSGNEVQSALRAVGTTFAFHSHIITDKPGGSGLVLADLDDMEVTVEHG